MSSFASKSVFSALFAFFLTAPLHAEMSLTSADIAPDTTIGDAFVFNGFGCTGPNTSPALAWEGAPEGTNSYIVNVYDPDAPTGSGFWHWAVFDLPASVTELPQGAASALPEGAMQARNDYSANDWGGPCPPEGDTPHRYVFTVYAMPQEKLGIDETASGAVVGFFAHTSSLDSASFTATYGR
ncbi:PBP family phospholipid-binding protein [Rhodobacter aestuarii]|uniref:Phospholipid-binding protein, PBP family n=2 Tax=Rhodobacter group TaxID=3374108 RepID=A0A1N7MWJ9_9RHOB|nr:PBP family phospholipid-binding protein [Rhodobacter aestuarii]SIS90466.1 phospholipid-binding protein, PBP family [Rhodobacter aestuarii]SOB91899.1 PBP family phospholipid-binding protein [Rhodobacter sp. JA431]